MASKKPPTELITYFCTRCNWDFARTENDTPRCTLCEKDDQLKELKREPITPQVIEAGMMRSMDRLMTSLQKAYDSGMKEGMGDKEEILVLEALAKAKHLQEHVQKVFRKSTKKPRLHVQSVSL